MAGSSLPNGTHASGPHSYTHVPHDSALSVGTLKAEEDAAKIKELEAEVRVLAEKANSASQRFADYENDIRVLEAKLRQEQRKNSVPIVATKTESPDSTPPQEKPVEKPGISRFGSIMGNRIKQPAVQQNGSSGASSIREKELEEKLVKEQTTRIAAEQKVKEVNAEIEDLSATLFQQANEMVANERKENYNLREKVQALEQHKKDLAEPEALHTENVRLKEKLTKLEQREADRKRRLERLEAANKRIERVRAMLQPP